MPTRSVPRLVPLDDRVTPSVFTVSTAADSGTGSLRAAITAANAAAGADTIAFAIPGAAGISLTSALPAITDTLIIDGTTQPGYSPTAKLPLVELIGNSLAASGLVVQAPNCQILALNIHNFDNDGIQLRSSGGLIADCFIGTDRNGKVDLGNGVHGIGITGANNTVRGNVVSGNNDDGIEIRDPAATGNFILGNRIGVDVTGGAGLGNAKDGVLIINAPNNTVGGVSIADRNIISANGLNTANWHQGVRVTRDGADNTLVINNYIGLDITGLVDLGNGGGGGVRIDSGPDNTTLRGNVISGNASYGVSVISAGTNGSVIAGNVIGLSAAGNSRRPNTSHGVVVDDGPDGTRIGGDAAADRNIISGNLKTGVVLQKDTIAVTNAQIINNYIGTNKSGTASNYNSDHGVVLDNAGSGAIIRNNLVSGNQQTGVFVRGVSNAQVLNNSIGVNTSGGVLANGERGVVIDAATGTAVTGNTIRNNGLDGIAVLNNTTAVGNTFRTNSVAANGGLGIDLADNGVTVNDGNDADSGPNGLLNFPVLTTVVPGFTTRFIGTFASVNVASATYTLDFYGSTAGDPTGYGEGERHLGSATITAVNGTASFNILLPAATGDGEIFSATATDAAGNTSEFSLARTGTVSAGVVAGTVNGGGAQRSRVTSVELSSVNCFSLPSDN